jgi:hypothetical protein
MEDNNDAHFLPANDDPVNLLCEETIELWTEPEDVLEPEDDQNNDMVDYYDVSDDPRPFFVATLREIRYWQSDNYEEKRILQNPYFINIIAGTLFNNKNMRSRYAENPWRIPYYNYLITAKAKFFSQRVIWIIELLLEFFSLIPNAVPEFARLGYTRSLLMDSSFICKVIPMKDDEAKPKIGKRFLRLTAKEAEFLEAELTVCEKYYIPKFCVVVLL